MSLVPLSFNVDSASMYCGTFLMIIYTTYICIFLYLIGFIQNWILMHLNMIEKKKRIATGFDDGNALLIEFTFAFVPFWC